MAGHSQTPWRAGKLGYIRDADDVRVAEVLAPCRAENAAFICKAVNLHDELVAALQWALPRIGEPTLIRGQNDTHVASYAAASAALAKATTP